MILLFRYYTDSSFQFGGVPIIQAPTYKSQIGIRQYSQNGRFTVYNGPIDLDCLYINYPQLFYNN